MASKVVIPADFSEHLSCKPAHNNITFIVRKGKRIPANSVIMSLNSPVIADSITNSQITSFKTTYGKETMNNFVNVVLNGSVKALKIKKVKGVMEIAREFQVSWLIDKCEECFGPYLDTLDCKESRSAMKLAANLDDAPKVCIPADFGRHLIGSPLHENLTFNLMNGIKVGANSLIMSLNSPVIDDLIKEKRIPGKKKISKQAYSFPKTQINAEDCSREAVDCFVEAIYTGEVETLNLKNFRDVNKMSRMFKVSWLAAKCEEYFVSYLEMLNDESSYSDILFAVEEAVFLLLARKNWCFLNLVSKKMASLSELKRKNFVKEYTIDLDQLTVHKMDGCIAVLKSEVHLLAELLTAYFNKYGRVSLDGNSRQLLRNLDMAKCFQETPELYNEIFETLECLSEVSQDDLKLFVHLQKETTNHHAQTISRHVIVLETPQHWDRGFKIYNFLQELSAREDITSLYSLIDGLWMRLYEMEESNLSAGYYIINKVKKLANMRCWPPVDRYYTTRSCFLAHSTTESFIKKLNTCGKLVSKMSDDLTINVCEYSQPEFVEELFNQDNMFKFQIPGSYYAGQTFVLLTSGVKKHIPNSFDLRWCLFDTSPIIHRSHRIPKSLHFALVVQREGNASCILPITWCGQPRYKSNACWNWGYIRFHHKKCPLKLGEDKVCCGSISKYAHIVSSDTVKIVAFEIY